MSETQAMKKWYEKTWVIILFLIFFFPVGLTLMWRFAKWSNTVKIIVTIVVAILFVLLIILLFFTTTAIIGFMLFTANKEESLNLQESGTYEEPNTEQDENNQYFSDNQAGEDEWEEEDNAQQENNEFAALDQFDIQFDDREWFVNFEESQQGVLVREYLLEGESADSWNEVVTLHFMKDMQEQPLQHFVDQLKMETEQNGMDSEDYEINVLEESDRDLTYEFKMKDGLVAPGRHELARVMKADTGIYILHYANAEVPMPDETKEEWLDLLEQTRIKDK